ncbi:MAG TPA: chemotaxis-specific protein-glutamate methyltransferase CheB [Lacipirellulaceae bacterium]|jgi:two-component system chemotaxis response regulator CheB
MDQVRVMIVEDSPTVREYLRQAISADPRLAVVAECESAEQALASVARTAPDVISMDIHLPHMSGLEATRRIMETRPTPIVIVSRSVNAKELDSTMDALRAGAVSAVEKPSCQQSGKLPHFAARICRELVVMSQVKVIRQRFNNSNVKRVEPATSVPRSSCPIAVPNDRRASLVGIVASTGGPHAIETVLATVGSDFAIPIVLVQHMTASFHGGFISWLDRISPQTVTEARHGELPMPGRVYVAPADQHLVVRGNRLTLENSQQVSGQRPSGTVLLRSMAEALGSRAVGVVLTGMGDDGAEGLLAIRRAGGYTIAEHESTAIVNGMPAVARNLNAECISLPLESIGTAIRNLVPASREVCA